MVQWKRICLPMQEPQETWVQSLDQEDPMEEEMVTHSNILALEIPKTEERSLMGYSPWGCKELDTSEQLSLHTNNTQPNLG